MENERKQSKFLSLLFLSLGVGIFYFLDGGASLGGFTVMTKYMYAMGITVLGLLVFLVAPDMDMAKRLGTNSFVLALPYLITTFLSLILWITQNSPLSHITRGFFFSLYQVLGVLTAMAYVLVLRKKAVIVQLFSMLAANALLIFAVVKEEGLGVFVKDYFALILSFGAESSQAMKAIEINDLTFAIGVYLLYFLLKEAKVKGRVWLILLTGLFFSTGLKRIAAAALLVSFVVGVIAKIFPEKEGKRMLKIFGYIVIISGIAYIGFVRFGLYELLEIWEIDTKGRNLLHDFIYDYYKISPFFMGHGLGYVSRLLLSGEADKYGVFYALHNDYLRMYIEVGFWGYLAWLWFSWGHRISYFCKKRSFHMVCMTAMLFGYCFITYLTDNTYYYFYTNLAVFTLVLSYEAEYQETEAANGNT